MLVPSASNNSRSENQPRLWCSHSGDNTPRRNRARLLKMRGERPREEAEPWPQTGRPGHTPAYGFSEYLTGVRDSHQHSHSETPPNSQPRDTKQVEGEVRPESTRWASALESGSPRPARVPAPCWFRASLPRPQATALPPEKPKLSRSATAPCCCPARYSICADLLVGLHDRNASRACALPTTTAHVRVEFFPPISYFSR